MSDRTFYKRQAIASPLPMPIQPEVRTQTNH